MSVSVASSTVERRPSFQPFQCTVCQSRFTRHENLKRHAALHTRSSEDTALSCELCNATFSRPDLRHRHMKRKHPNHEDLRPKKRHASQHPRSGGTNEETASASPTDSRCSLPSPPSGDENIDRGFWQTTMRNDRRHRDDDSRSESTCLTTSLPLNDQQHTVQIESSQFTQELSMESILQDANTLESTLLIGTSFDGTQFHSNITSTPTSQPAFDTSLSTFGFDPGITENLSTIDTPQAHDDWYPSHTQISRGCDLFFHHISNFLPLLHRPTFDAAQTPRSLLYAILCLAYQYGEDPDVEIPQGSGASLSVHCYQQARAILSATATDDEDVSTHCLATVQTFLLLQVYAMMYLCGKDSAYGLKTHSKIISIARSGGLTQPVLVEPSANECLDYLWRQFISAESHKRTMFAVHQIDTMWYQFLSMPRSLSHLEIKHDLPCPEELWIASSSGEWAHRQLVGRHANPSMQYSDAVRRFLSSDAGINSIPAFDPYGTINITQFLISSAREISGWSTMTGMLSMERLDPLRSSLLALSPYVHSQPGASKTAHAALCEATWETAMIELQMWSPSHTGGIVEGSMDAVLHQLTTLAPSCEFLCESNIADAIQPHVDWFLRYLDATLVPDCEAPWLIVYAYKAFMIAWQLIKGGIPGSMHVVGVNDVAGAIDWAKKVFRRRQKWQLGKIVLACLDRMEK
ncbi:fungal-specific transcription factor domain-containing protein [Dendryphion nanum]|uniref:Fungal-specific transcription factor domain-containing protein n=1 Tax=Dendryphion nanum TaxID=256645 RepID=A0A9P9IXQ5_9PLEO|nr:fungal-specific transcription factor domain-containing protein [Dendryphion nanum]